MIAKADNQPSFLAALDRPVRTLAPVASSEAMIAMETPKRAPAASAAAPALVATGSAAASLGAPAGDANGIVATVLGGSVVSPVAAADATAPRRHTVAAGENLWTIARRYKVSVAQLVSANGLKAGKLLAPGMVLAVDALAAK